MFDIEVLCPELSVEPGKQSTYFSIFHYFGVLVQNFSSYQPTRFKIFYLLTGSTDVYFSKTTRFLTPWFL